MVIIRSIKGLRKVLSRCRDKGESIGFVPTMGALHEGHLSLIRAAGQNNDRVVASIFVNPAQFGPGEDFKKYPRNLKKDASLCRKNGVDVIFYPDASQMFPEGYRTFVEVTGLSDILCGKFRPGHFRGVATVVTKLFNIVQPDTAYFGQKDAQQAVIIKKMARDLDMPLKVQVMPTVREKSGLAMSSRNTYLRPEEKKSAQVLYRALSLAGKLIRSGGKDSAAILRGMKNLILQEDKAKIDYIAIVGREDLKPLRKVSGNCLITLAVRIGKVRLIDNIVINA